jgi:exonuclease III
MTDAYVTALAYNIEKGVNLEPATNWVVQQRPDIFFMQEVQPGQLDTLTRLLDMDGYLAVHRPGSTNDNAIFLRRGGPLTFTEEYPQGWAPWHAPANIAVKMTDPDGTVSPRQISCVSGHASYFSSAMRLVEAQWCTTLAKPDWLTVLLYDWNSYRAGTTIEWEQYEDRAFFAARTYFEGRQRLTDDRPDRELTAAGYIEMARWAAEHRDQPEAMIASSGFRPHPGRPRNAPRHCVDRGYMSAELAPALTSFTVCDTEQLRQMSDHLPLLARFDRDALRTILHKPARPYEPSVYVGGNAQDTPGGQPA